MIYDVVEMDESRATRLMDGKDIFQNFCQNLDLGFMPLISVAKPVQIPKA